jgi:uncharacterized protein YukE
VADGVSIDTEQVGATAKQIRKDAETYFADGVRSGQDLHGQGVVFGARYPGGSVAQAKQQYAEALAILDANLRNYQLAAELYAEAAERIAKLFAQADLSSAQRQQALESALGEASAAIRKKHGIAAPPPQQAASPGSSEYAGGML